MKNINKQEELVTALWNFARKMEYSTDKTARSVGKDGIETHMDMQAMHEALHTIAKIFNLEIQEVQ